MQTRYLEIDDLTDDLRDHLEEAAPDVAEHFRQVFDYSWIHHENHLEGQVFTFEEVHAARTQTVVTDLAHVTLFKKIRAWFTALEMARAEAEKKKFEFSVELFQSFYETIFFGLDRDKGKFRKDIPLHRTYYHDIAQPKDILPGLEKLVVEANDPDFSAMHPIKQAAVFEWKFMQVFPWSEASGPVGRMMGNILLMRAGYHPAVVHAQDRERFYAACKSGHVDLRELLMESMENSLRNSLKFLSAKAMERRGQVG